MPDLAQQVLDQFEVHEAASLVYAAATKNVRTAVLAVLKRHTPIQAIDDCAHPEHQTAEPTVYDPSEPLCPDASRSTICRSCCVVVYGDDGQSEDCSERAAHDHCWPCPTVRDIAGALGIEVPS